MFETSFIKQKLKPISNKNWDTVKKTRDFLLQKSDWTQLPNGPLSTQKQQQWAVYRQALRDITQQDINNIIWPKEPK